MKYLILLLGIIWGGYSFGAEDHFVLRGSIHGLKDGAVVELFTGRSTFLSAKLENGQFEFRGKMDRPTHCRLRIHEGRRYWKADFFVENGELVFETAHVDSLSRMFQNEDVRKDKNYRLTGSAAQDAYAVYQQRSIPLRYAIEKLMKQCGEEDTSENYRLLHSKQAELRQLAGEFIRSQRNLYVNLYVAAVFDKAPFTYDKEYAEGVLDLFAPYRDTCKLLRDFRAKWEGMRAFVPGKPLKDAAVETPEGKEERLLGLLNPDGYTLVDLWASWCGPCRKGFPALRKLHERYGDKVKFVSVAMFDEKDTWLKAMREENLPWPQFKDTDEVAELMKASYNTTGVPSFFLIDPEGRVVYKASRSGDMEVQLENIFK